MAEKNFSVDNDVVTICGDAECCPTVDFSEGGKVILRDDDGGKVMLTEEQYKGLENFILRDHGHM